MEFLSQYDRKIVYIKGEDNSVADALSGIPIDAVHITNSAMEAETHATPVFHDASNNKKIASILTCKDVGILGDLCLALIASISERVNEKPLIVSITANTQILNEIKEGYINDPFIVSLKVAAPGTSFVSEKDSFWFIGT